MIVQFFDRNWINPKDNEQLSLGDFTLCVNAQRTFLFRKIERQLNGKQPW